MKKRLLSTLLALCLALALLPMTACLPDNASGTCGGNVTWAYDHGTLTIEGTGSMDDYNFVGDSLTKVPWQNYIKIINTVIIGDGVTSIGICAFWGCSSLTDVTIPDSVTTIGWGAFTACESLTGVTIPNSVTTIANMEFSGCSSLTSVTIPDSVTTIGESAFSGCNSLTDVYFGGSESQWKQIFIDFANEPLTGAAIHFNS